LFCNLILPLFDLGDIGHYFAIISKTLMEICRLYCWTVFSHYVPNVAVQREALLPVESNYLGLGTQTAHLCSRGAHADAFGSCAVVRLQDLTVADHYCRPQSSQQRLMRLDVETLNLYEGNPSIHCNSS